MGGQLDCAAILQAFYVEIKREFGVLQKDCGCIAKNALQWRRECTLKWEYELHFCKYQLLASKELEKSKKKSGVSQVY